MTACMHVCLWCVVYSVDAYMCLPLLCAAVCVVGMCMQATVCGGFMHAGHRVWWVYACRPQCVVGICMQATVCGGYMHAGHSVWWVHIVSLGSSLGHPAGAVAWAIPQGQ